MMSALGQDMRFGLRSLLKHPGHTAVVVLTLALGIGANTAIFSVIHAVLLRPLPYADPDRLVLLRHRIEATEFYDGPMPPADVMDIRDHTDVFEGVAATDRTFEQNLTGDGDPIEVRVAGVTANFFDVLGVQAAVGRTFVPEDEEPFPPDAFAPGAPPPVNNVVISHGLWMRRFGGSPEVIGSTLRINDFANTVVGVMPAGFELLMPANAGMPSGIDVWNPTRFDYRQQPRTSANANRRVIARLKPGVTLAQAQLQVDKVAAWQRDRFEYNRDGEIYIDVKPMHADIVGHARTILLALFGAVAFVLLIACANVANLLLVQAAAREKEMAIRAALGGSRGRIVRQLLTESILLAVVGGLAGLLLARWGVDLLLALRPANLPRVSEVGIGGPVLLFTLGASLFAAVIFGLVPALQASKPDLNDCLKDRGTVSPDVRRRRLRSVLVVAEVALSMVLLIGAGLMFRSFLALQHQDLGFEPKGVVTFRIAMPGLRSEYGSPDDRALFVSELEQRLEALPGVKRAGAVQVLPLSGRFWTSPYSVKNADVEDWGVLEADYRFATPGYFSALGLRLLDGRFHNQRENDDASEVVIVDRALAARAWPGEDPIGRYLQTVVSPFDGTGPQQRWVKVVGVVENVRSQDPRVAGRETIYFPYRLQGAFFNVTMAVRTEKDPATLVPAIRAVVAGLDPEMPVAAVTTMDEYVRLAKGPTRFAMILIGIFAGVALVLASVGLYGVISSLVRQRTHEIGVYMAFGAESPHILRMVVRRGIALAVAGVAVGLVVSLALTRAVASLLTGVTATDPATFLAVGILLTVVTLLASYIPAHRAVRVDPMEALRYH
ncbi:MAG: ABC transporter permease [Candidatus Palauibacterales bacterium]|nr:ABC transporter permease [Candidatus Palauibacterales bacterium]MDP2482621.1 ABC transporter permease [Candidatus Palauibacterales bacterium]